MATVGDVVSIVRVDAAEGVDVRPPPSVAVAVMLWTPSVNALAVIVYVPFTAALSPT
jgi:hypothetical protein